MYNPWLDWCLDWTDGVFWFRVLGRGLQLKAPWWPACFSERNGRSHLARAFGWRLRHLPPYK